MKIHKSLFFIIASVVGIVLGLIVAYYNVRISEHAKFLIILSREPGAMIGYTLLTACTVLATAYFIVDMVKIDRSVISCTVKKLWHTDGAHYITISLVYTHGTKSTDDNTQTILIDPDTFGQFNEKDKAQVERTVNLLGDISFELSKLRA